MTPPVRHPDGPRGRMPPSRPPRQVRALGAAIEAWGRSDGGTTRRDDLPWRSTRDPWAVLVSETLAQQTQLSRVVPAYHRFLAAFPTPSSCAAAPLGDVLRAWEGMGYNRRARNLHLAAAAVVERHGGRGARRPRRPAGAARGGPLHGPRRPRLRLRARRGVVDTNAGRVLVPLPSAGRPLRPVEAQAWSTPWCRPAGAGRSARPSSTSGRRCARPGPRRAGLPAAPTLPVGRGRPARRPTRPGARPGCRSSQARSPGPTARAGAAWSPRCVRTGGRGRRRRRGRLARRPGDGPCGCLDPAGGRRPGGPRGPTVGATAREPHPRPAVACPPGPHRRVANLSEVRTPGVDGPLTRRQGEDHGRTQRVAAVAALLATVGLSVVAGCGGPPANVVAGTDAPRATAVPTGTGHPPPSGAPVSVAERVVTVPTPAGAGHAGPLRPGPGPAVRPVDGTHVLVLVPGTYGGAGRLRPRRALPRPARAGPPGVVGHATRGRAAGRVAHPVHAGGRRPR